MRSFLDLISSENPESNYPYSTPKYREMFRHTLWMVPGVKEASALSRLLKDHPVFGAYKIANVAGDGDAEMPYDNALTLVKQVIKTNRYTISCGNIISDETLRQEIGSGYDVITANIVADVIKGMAPLFPGFLKDNGILILSGIITERADEVLDTVTAYDFAVLERREASGWCAVKLQKLAGAGTSCDTVRK